VPTRTAKCGEGMRVMSIRFPWDRFSAVSPGRLLTFLAA